MRERALIIHAIQCVEAFAELFSSTTPTPAPMTAEREYAWLIECRIGPDVTYIQLKNRAELSQQWEQEIHAHGYNEARGLKPWHFTKDATSATRFAREEDAARAMVALGIEGPTGPLDWLKPTEHAWLSPEAPDRAALTARVAELERERESWLEACEAGYASKIARAEVRAQAAEAENKRLREALIEARACIADWGSYAGEYFQSVHDLAGDLARIDAALQPQGDATTPCRVTP